jgi:hypothetical protein
MSNQTENTALMVAPQNKIAEMPDNMQLGGDFWTSAAAFNTALRMAQALAASTIIPKEFQNNVSNTLIALEMSARMKTSPMQVMQNLFVVNGRPAWSSQYIIAVINASRKYRHELKFELSGKGDNLACYAWVTDMNGERIEGPTITMQMAKDEGWVSRNGSKWKTMPEVMIRYRAAAFFGRLYCSDMIMGIYDREEIIELSEDDYYVSAQDRAEATIAQNANATVVDAEAVTGDPLLDLVNELDKTAPPAEGGEGQQTLDGKPHDAGF